MSVISTNNFRFIDELGNLIPEGKFYVYNTSSHTNQAKLYADANLATSLQNPITLNSSGGTGAFFMPAGDYSYVVQDTNNQQQATGILSVIDNTTPTLTQFNALKIDFNALNDAVTEKLNDVSESNFLIGEVRFGIFNPQAPSWLPLDGRAVSRAEYPELYAILTSQYQVVASGAASFLLPDLSGRYPIVYSSDYPIGATGGSDTAQLGIDNMPNHSHDLNSDLFASSSNNASAGSAVKGFDTGKNPNTIKTGGTNNAGDVLSGSKDLDQSGATSEPFSTLPPYLSLKAYIYTGR